MTEENKITTDEKIIDGLKKTRLELLGTSSEALVIQVIKNLERKIANEKSKAELEERHAAASNTRSDVAKLEKQIKVFETQQKSVDKELKALKQTSAEEVNKLNASLKKVTATKDGLHDERRELGDKLTVTSRELSAQKQECAKFNEIIKALKTDVAKLTDKNESLHKKYVESSDFLQQANLKIQELQEAKEKKKA